jgi:hypothetical protein
MSSFKEIASQSAWDVAAQHLRERKIFTKYRRNVLMESLFQLNFLSTKDDRTLEQRIASFLIDQRKSLRDGTRFGLADKDPRMKSLKQEMALTEQSTVPQVKAITYKTSSMAQANIAEHYQSIEQAHQQDQSSDWLEDMYVLSQPEKDDYNSFVMKKNQEFTEKLARYKDDLDFLIQRCSEKFLTSKLANVKYEKVLISKTTEIDGKKVVSEEPRVQLVTLADKTRMDRKLLNTYSKIFNSGFKFVEALKDESDPENQLFLKELLDNVKAEQQKIEDITLYLLDVYKVADASKEVKNAISSSVEIVFNNFQEKCSRIYCVYKDTIEASEEYKQDAEAMLESLKYSSSLFQFIIEFGKGQLGAYKQAMADWSQISEIEVGDLIRSFEIDIDILEKDLEKLINDSRLDIMSIFVAQFHSIKDYVNFYQLSFANMTNDIKIRDRINEKVNHFVQIYDEMQKRASSLYDNTKKYSSFPIQRDLAEVKKQIASTNDKIEALKKDELNKQLDIEKRKKEIQSLTNYIRSSPTPFDAPTREVERKEKEADLRQKINELNEIKSKIAIYIKSLDSFAKEEQDIAYHPVRKHLALGRIKLGTVDRILQSYQTILIDDFSDSLRDEISKEIISKRNGFRKKNIMKLFIDSNFADTLKEIQTKEVGYRSILLGSDELNMSNIEQLKDQLSDVQKRDFLRDLRVTALIERRFIFTTQLNLRYYKVSDEAFQFIRSCVRNRGIGRAQIKSGLAAMIASNNIDTRDILQYSEFGDELELMAKIINDSQAYVDRIELFFKVWAKWDKSPEIQKYIREGSTQDQREMNDFFRTIESGQFKDTADPFAYIPTDFITEIGEGSFVPDKQVSDEANTENLERHIMEQYRAYVDPGAFTYNGLVVYRIYRHVDMYDGIISSFFLEARQIKGNDKLAAKRAQQELSLDDEYRIQNKHLLLEKVLGSCLTEIFRMYIDELTFSFKIPSRSTMVNEYWKLCDAYAGPSIYGADKMSQGANYSLPSRRQIIKFLNQMYANIVDGNPGLHEIEEDEEGPGDSVQNIADQVIASIEADEAIAASAESLTSEGTDEGNTPNTDVEDVITEVIDDPNAAIISQTTNDVITNILSTTNQQTTSNKVNTVNNVNRQTQNISNNAKINITTEPKAKKLAPTLSAANEAKAKFNTAAAAGLDSMESVSLVDHEAILKVALDKLKKGMIRATSKKDYEDRIIELQSRIDVIAQKLAERD